MNGIEVQETISTLVYVSGYNFSYTNMSHEIIPNSLFTVKLYADKEGRNSPLFVVSEPEGYHIHIVQNASERLADIILNIENKEIDLVRKLGDRIAKNEFQAAIIQDMMSHAAIDPSRNDLNTLESTAMLTGFIYEGISFLKELRHNHLESKSLHALLANSLFAEHTRHEHGSEFISLVTYASGSREQIIRDCTVGEFRKAFGINVLE